MTLLGSPLFDSQLTLHKTGTMGSSQSSEREPEPSKVIETDEKLQEKPERVDDDDEPDEW